MYQQIQKSIYSAWSCCILHLHGVGSCFVVYFGARVLKTLPLFSKQTLFFSFLRLPRPQWHHHILLFRRKKRLQDFITLLGVLW